MEKCKNCQQTIEWQDEPFNEWHHYWTGDPQCIVNGDYLMSGAVPEEME